MFVIVFTNPVHHNVVEVRGPYGNEEAAWHKALNQNPTGTIGNVFPLTPTITPR